MPLDDPDMESLGTEPEVEQVLELLVRVVTFGDDLAETTLERFPLVQWVLHRCARPST
jgi:hypothetical protein